MLRQTASAQALNELEDSLDGVVGGLVLLLSFLGGLVLGRRSRHVVGMRELPT